MTEVIDRKIDPETPIEIPILGFNGELAFILIKRFPAGQFGEHDEIHIIIDGEDLGYLVVNSNRGMDAWTVENQRRYAAWFSNAEDRGVSFDLGNPVVETTVIGDEHVNFHHVKNLEPEPHSHG